MKLGRWAAGLAIVAAVFALAAAGRQKSQPPAPPPTVDIYRAGVKDFEELPGIGPELARRIVAYRQKHGPFRRIEDLLAVRGMGPAKWRAIRPYLKISPREEKR